ncbi:ankyrin repeat and SOCS box protein 14 [Procambarus clarkii]|uniref:ankyrin repeat and SOCS box protein 14 n=1 Tax=Procambarus clarkii TaxID=6728 RepID=UPI003742E9B6
MDFTEAYDDTNTSVGLAARLGDARLLKELLQAGRPTNGHDNRGWRPLHEAAAGGHVDCVRLLLLADDVDVDALSHDGTSALRLACKPQPCYCEVVKLLLSAGADANMKGGDNWALPLPTAVANENLVTVRYLLDGGADPNREDYDSGVPLHVAASKGLLDIVELLLEKGADVNKFDDSQRTALHVLTYNQNKDVNALKVLELLLEKGSNVNARMQDGTTPLMLAVQSNWKEGVNKLLELGADVNIMKNDGVLALHFAIEFCVDYSEQQLCSFSEEERETSADRGCSDLLEKLLGLTSMELLVPKSTETLKYSLYHLAVEWNRFNSLRTLVEAGVPPDRFLQECSNAALDEVDVNLFRQVPLVLHLGTRVDTPLGFLLSKPLTRERVDTAKFMIDRGSCVNAVNSECLPPLAAAVKHQRISYSEGCLGSEIVQYLLDHGADVMYKIRDTDIIPVALHVSSLFNVVAFFKLLQQGVPANKIYNYSALQKLSQQYSSSEFYKVYSMFPWRVISWLHTLNLFVPQLVLDTSLLFDQGRMVDDESITKAWDNLDNTISSPKTLQQLSVLAVRRAVGEARSWNGLPASLDKLKLMNLPLPPIILNLLQFTQIESETLYHSPPISVVPSYLMPESPDEFHLTEDERDNDDDADEDADNNDDDGNHLDFEEGSDIEEMEAVVEQE